MTERVSFAASHIGLVRQTNEDSYSADDHLGLYVVADGMGGHPRGEDASRIAVAAVRNCISGAGKPAANQDVIASCMMAAHRAVAEANEHAATGRPGMGTTLAAVYVKGLDFVGANIGDSRIYWASTKEQRCTQLSRDHSMAAELILRGAPPEIARPRDNSTLTQAVGLGTLPTPHVVAGVLTLGDRMLLCSDGVTNHIGPETLCTELLRAQADARTIVDRFIELALEGGGDDNCTCICVTIGRDGLC